MKQLSIKTACFIALAAVLFASCSKEAVSAPGQGPEPPQATQELRVSLNEAYLPLAKVDSALMIWEAYGASQVVKLQAAGGVLKTSLAHFNNQGTGTLTIQLFTQVKMEGQPLQWEHRAAYTLDHRQPVQLAAPASIADPQWQPRVVFNYDNFMGSRFKAIVGLRPHDPYFELKGVEPYFAQKIEIKRSFHDKGSGQLVFSRGWVCEQASCLDAKGNLVNREHFRNLDEQLEGRQWDEFRVEAYFHLNSSPASVMGFALALDKLR